MSQSVTVRSLGPTVRPRREILLVALLAIWTQFDVWGSSPPIAYGHMVGPRPVVAALYAVTSLSLLWRASAPVTVLAFIAAADSAVYLAFGAPQGLGSFLPLLFAYYSVGRHAPTRSVLVAAPLAALGIGIHDATDPIFSFGGASAFFWLVLASAWPIGYAFRRRDAEAELLERRAHQLAAEREWLAEEAVRGERARIARELHDVVGHGLSVIVLQLVATLALLEKGDAGVARQRLVRTERSAREALAEMRRLLDLIDEGEAPPLAPQPGLGQVERLVADTRAAGADVDVTITGTPLELPPGLDLATFRVLQESLTNVLKHARPPTAHIRIAYEADAVVIEIRDEGRGWSGTSTGGRGVAGMRERVALYGGDLRLGPEPGGGYAVRARLPMPG